MFRVHDCAQALSTPNVQLQLVWLVTCVLRYSELSRVHTQTRRFACCAPRGIHATRPRQWSGGRGGDCELESMGEMQPSLGKCMGAGLVPLVPGVGTSPVPCVFILRANKKPCSIRWIRAHTSGGGEELAASASCAGGACVAGHVGLSPCPPGVRLRRVNVQRVPDLVEQLVWGGISGRRATRETKHAKASLLRTGAWPAVHDQGMGVY